MDEPIVKSQNEIEMMKPENIDRLIGDISASYDKDRKVRPYIKRCHIYEIISAHTDARLGESDIQVKLIKEMKKRVLELKELYPLSYRENKILVIRQCHQFLQHRNTIKVKIR